MAEESFVKIVETSLSLDLLAQKLYKFYRKTEIDIDLKNFWGEYAYEEACHAEYWSKVLELVKDGEIQNVFDNPKAMLESVQKTSIKANQIWDNRLKHNSPKLRLLAACRFEIFMLAPAFETIYHLVKDISGDTSPEDHYHEHLIKLFKIIRNQPFLSIEMELMLELMESTWSNNLELAKQLKEIHVLRGLVPVCSSCHKVRNTENKWDELEDYFSALSQVQLSHTLCDNCVQKLYPDIDFDDE